MAVLFQLYYVKVCLLKVKISPSKKLVIFVAMATLLKMIKIIFDFMLKALFVLEILTSLSSLFDYVQKRA